MNEEQKNIETCLPENILSEVANVPTDPQFRSLVEESFDPLQQQALQQAGYDGYIKVAGTHQPYTFTSQVKQMKSNLILLLRRLWRYPFGRGNTSSSAAGSSAASAAGSSSAASSAAAPIRSLADMWQHYITRLKGNPEYSIPSRLSSLTDLPSAPALLADRKIGGVPEAADGISLVHLLVDLSSVKELTDDNAPYTSTIIPWSYLPSVEKVQCNISSISEIDNFITLSTLKELRLDELELVNINGAAHQGFGLMEGTEIEEVELPKLKKIITRDPNGHNYSWFILSGCSKIKKASFPVLTSLSISNRAGSSDHYVGNCPLLEELRLPLLTTNWQSSNLVDSNGGTNFGYNCPNLILFEIGQGYNKSLYLAGWSPTMALRTDTTAEDYVDLREDMTLENNLQQFLSNFKTYIAERLTDKGTGLTLTLSQEVRNAIHSAEATYGIENIIITQKGWTISPAPN